MLTDLRPSGLQEMILSHEGDTFTNHPADKGGPTRYGITQKVLSAYLRRPATVNEVRYLRRETAAQIYLINYIHPFMALGETMLRANVVDMGVNAGIVRSTRLLQQTVGVAVDGALGPRTLAAVKARDWNDIYTGVRLAFYERLVENDPSQLVWRNGWRNRCLSFAERDFAFQIDLYAKQMAYPGWPSFGHTGKAYL